eukprot:6146990-Pyramimonas_sp.AAC.1
MQRRCIGHALATSATHPRRRRGENGAPHRAASPMHHRRGGDAARSSDPIHPDPIQETLSCGRY